MQWGIQQRKVLTRGNLTRGLTLRAEPTRDAWSGGGHVCQAQGPTLKVLVSEQVSQAHFGCMFSDVYTELLE